MPLYDYRCEHCEGIFEKSRSIKERRDDVECPYCHQTTKAQQMVTGGFVSLAVREKWKPASKAQSLTGPNSSGPGTSPNAKRAWSLHTCKGFNCSICNT